MHNLLIQRMDDSLTNWHPSRKKTLIAMVKGIIYKKSVHQAESGIFLLGDKSSTTGYCNRIRRLLKEQEMDDLEIAQIIRTVLPSQKLVLAIDRTHWERGNDIHNYLVLSAIIENTAVPLFISHLPKKGNSNT